MKTSGQKKRRGLFVCAAGILLNFLLSAGKIAAGILAGSLSVTADGLNNLSDCGSGIVAFCSFFLAEKPADAGHPFGHRRAEYIASMIAGCFILFLAAELLRGAVESLAGGRTPSGSWIVYPVLGVSLAVKLGMFALYRVSAKDLGSKTLKAAATDSLCDCLATAAAAAGAALSPLLPAIDGWIGAAVALFIAWQGIRILAEAGSELIGRAADPALAEQIKAIVLSEKDILGVHDLQIYGYGKGVSFATIHAEMDASFSMLDAHAVIDGLEARVRRETGVLLTVHLDPVDLANREEALLKRKIGEAARELAEGLELHDFRLIPGTNFLEFDVGVPYSCKLSDEALSSSLVSIVKEVTEREPRIRIERE